MATDVNPSIRTPSKNTSGAGPDELIVTSPWDGKEIGRVPIDGPDQVAKAVASARQAQKAWAATSLRDRVRALKKLRGVFLQRSEEIVDLVVRENGKTREEAIAAEVLAPMLFMSYFLARGPQALQPHKIRGWGMSVFVTRGSWAYFVPRGVIGVISPWNYPVVVPMSDIFPALLAGNAVVLKPSEWTPMVSLKLKEIFDDSGMDPDLFQVVNGWGPTGAALVEADTDKIVFTGSTNVGRRVGEACGRLLKPCTLELGGKASAIVLEDADLERTARALVWGGFFNCGQTCIGIERVLAHTKIYDALLDRCVQLTQSMRLGTTGQLDMGAMPFPKQVETVDRLVRDAEQKGASILTGGARPAGAGRFYPPTIVAGATRDMAIVNEEIFGPALPFSRFEDVDDAIEWSNTSHLGLNAYVFGGKRKATRDIASRIQAGTVMINDVLTSFAYPELPFGGLKASGLGRNHGISGLRELCETRIVTDRRALPNRRELWWHPYHRGIWNLVQRNLGLLARILDSTGWIG